MGPRAEAVSLVARTRGGIDLNAEECKITSAFCQNTVLTRYHCRGPVLILWGAAE